jgi:hypothetical protein
VFGLPHGVALAALVAMEVLEDLEPRAARGARQEDCGAGARVRLATPANLVQTVGKEHRDETERTDE